MCFTVLNNLFTTARIIISFCYDNVRLKISFNDELLFNNNTDHEVTQEVYATSGVTEWEKSPQI